MSRQAVVDLCNTGKIDHTRIGKHRRLPLQSVLAHRAVRVAAKERALDDLMNPIGAPTVEDVRSLGEIILTIVEGHGGSNVRIFGSVARGEAHPGSDLDLLIDVPRGTGLIDLGRIEDELNDALPWRVDVVTTGATRGRMEHVNDEAIPL